MPELPEVETTRRGIEPYLLANRFSRIKVRQPSLRWPIPKNLSAMTNRKIESVTRRGKYILISLGRHTIIIHLGMSGSLRLTEKQVPLRKHDHVSFGLSDDGLELRYHDPRRFGCILLASGDVFTHPLLEKLGPEPLSNEFTSDYLFKLSRKRKCAIKNFIMDSRTVVGVGNIYASEALYLSGIRPGKAAGRISTAASAQLTVNIKKVLKNAIEMGGTTLRDFVNSDGDPGYFAQELRVYGRAGKPCTTCETTIKAVVIGQRSSFYCPACQS